MPPNRAASLIDARSLLKVYAAGDTEVRALDGVSLSVDTGDFVAIMDHDNRYGRALRRGEGHRLVNDAADALAVAICHLNQLRI